MRYIIAIKKGFVKHKMIYFNEIIANLEARDRDVPNFLPMSGNEISNPDFVLVTGDAYVDHPSFGAALIGKLLWAKGFSVGIIAAPDVLNKTAFKTFGRPRLGFLVTSGNVDSMVNNYTVALKRRRQDVYAHGGQAIRPNRAVIVYCGVIREVYGDVPVIIGGLEASLRRLGHYDYWDNKVRQSVLLDSGANLLVYGMGERQILAVAEALAAGVSVSNINYIEGTVWKAGCETDLPKERVELPDFKEICVDKSAYAKSFVVQYNNTAWQNAAVLTERYRNCTIVQNPPSVPLTRTELDYVYGLRFAREPHPSYEGNVPSVQEVKFSITSSRGCFGACAFCALNFHQGRHVESRSHESVSLEALQLTKLLGFKAHIHDVGGPTANFRNSACQKSVISGCCIDKRCLTPKPCPNLDVDHSDYLELLRKLRALPGIKKVFIRSGIRFDYLMHDTDGAFMRELVEHHISGQLKVAPEHVSEAVLNLMGKPPFHVYKTFAARYKKLNEKLGKKQFLVPYLMSSHPGSGLRESIELAEYLRDANIHPEQVQDFYPTPGTVSTCMYYTGLNPFTGEKVYVARTPREKAMQRALIQYKNPKNKGLVIEALKKAGREDLIGYGQKCLVRPL